MSTSKKNTSVNRSFVFSVHKAGSSLLFGIIESLAEQLMLPAVSIPDELFKKGIFETEWAVDPKIIPCFSHARIYYGFREFPSIFGNLLRYKNIPCVLLIRDPRDALVSEFFSFGAPSGSHIMPENNSTELISRASQTEKLSIDDYVMHSASTHRAKLLEYLLRLPKQHTLLVYYDDLFYDKMKILKKILVHLAVSVDDFTLGGTIQKFDIRPDAEDASRHIRKATPGDHREKLQPATICWLNDYFGEVLYDLKRAFTDVYSTGGRF